MPRKRGTRMGAAALVGKMILLIAQGGTTSITLARQLKVSPRQVNRYIVQLKEAGWEIDRVGLPTRGRYELVLRFPQIRLAGSNRRALRDERR